MVNDPLRLLQVIWQDVSRWAQHDLVRLARDAFGWISSGSWTDMGLKLLFVVAAAVLVRSLWGQAGEASERRPAFAIAVAFGVLLVALTVMGAQFTGIWSGFRFPWRP